MRLLIPIVGLAPRASVRYRTQRGRLWHEAGVGFSCGVIAAAGLRFECFSIDDGQHTTRIFDNAATLKSSGRLGDTNPAHAQQVSNEFLCYSERIGMCTVVSHQQPASQTLVYLMKTHASRLRSELQQGYLQVTVEALPKSAAAGQLTVERHRADAPSSSRTPDACLERHAIDSQGYLQA